MKVVAEGEENKTIEKTAECNNPPDGSAANDDSHWSVTFGREDLNILQRKNMKALLRASIQSETGVTGTSQPQALFVEPNVQPVADGLSPSIVLARISHKV